jgi:hypothetical protein
MLPYVTKETRTSSPSRATCEKGRSLLPKPRRGYQARKTRGRYGATGLVVAIDERL